MRNKKDDVYYQQYLCMHLPLFFCSLFIFFCKCVEHHLINLILLLLFKVEFTQLFFLEFCRVRNFFIFYNNILLFLFFGFWAHFFFDIAGTCEWNLRGFTTWLLFSLINSIDDLFGIFYIFRCCDFINILCQRRPLRIFHDTWLLYIKLLIFFWDIIGFDLFLFFLFRLLLRWGWLFFIFKFLSVVKMTVLAQLSLNTIAFLNYLFVIIQFLIFIWAENFVLIGCDFFGVFLLLQINRFLIQILDRVWSVDLLLDGRLSWHEGLFVYGLVVFGFALLITISLSRILPTNNLILIFFTLLHILLILHF